MSTIDSDCELKRSLSTFFLPDLIFHNAEIYFKQQQSQKEKKRTTLPKKKKKARNCEVPLRAVFMNKIMITITIHSFIIQ